jgi:CHASE1-domain containing sensor protein
MSGSRASLIERRSALILAAAAVLPLCLTAGAYWRATEAAARSRQAQFDRQADQVAAAIQERIASFDEVLWGAAALMGHADAVRRDEWARYFHALDLTHREPAVVALEWIAYVPEAERGSFEAWGGPMPDGPSRSGHRSGGETHSS